MYSVLTQQHAVPTMNNALAVEQMTGQRATKRRNARRHNSSTDDGQKLENVQWHAQSISSVGWH
jgi:hypothetical protein